MKEQYRHSTPTPDFEDNPVEKLSKDDCARLFEFDNDAPLIMENKDYREIVGLNRGTDESRRTFVKPESPDYMHDSGIGKLFPSLLKSTIKIFLEHEHKNILSIIIIPMNGYLGN